MSKERKRILHISATIVIIALGVLGMRVLTASKPRIEKQKLTVPTPMVRTMNVETGSQTILVRGEGTVRPMHEIDLVPQVAGKVVYASTALVNGGVFRQGETLLQIDPVDYQLAVTLAEAKVKDAESRLQLAEEEAATAKEEWKLHSGFEEDTEPPPLVAKEPQLAAAQARLEAEKADLSKALLNLERTDIKAPFNGRVSNENVDLGQYVSVGKALATIYSTEAAEVVVPLENEKLFWFHVPDFTQGNDTGSPAKVHANIAGQDLSWSGKIVRTEGKLDERTRMINIVVRVEKPYAKKPPLAAGLFVIVDIKGRTLHDATVIPRSALHEGNMVWIVSMDNRLRFREVDVALLQGDKAIIQSGLAYGERVVITPLKAVTNGMAVRVGQTKGKQS